MSQWTHFLGVVRFDSMGANCLPPPPGKNELLQDQLSEVNAVFQTNIPNGSEGPLKIDTILTGRGPSVLITGDLRDFGKKDLEVVLEWVNDCNNTINKNLKKGGKNFNNLYFLRDAIIYCEVEFDDTLYLIRQIKDASPDASKTFYLDEREVKEAS